MDFKKIIEINTPIIVVASAILSPEKYITEKVKVKIMITEEGVFSVTPPEEAEKITQLIIKEFKYRLNKDIKDCVITDATANIGGNTINFAKHFKKVNSIEISDINFKALKNNINVYKDK